MQPRKDWYTEILLAFKKGRDSQLKRKMFDFQAVVPVPHLRFSLRPPKETSKKNSSHPKTPLHFGTPSRTVLDVTTSFIRVRLKLVTRAPLMVYHHFLLVQRCHFDSIPIFGKPIRLFSTVWRINPYGYQSWVVKQCETDRNQWCWTRFTEHLGFESHPPTIPLLPLLRQQQALKQPIHDSNDAVEEDPANSLPVFCGKLGHIHHLRWWCFSLLAENPRNIGGLAQAKHIYNYIHIYINTYIYIMCVHIYIYMCVYI